MLIWNVLMTWKLPRFAQGSNAAMGLRPGISLIPVWISIGGMFSPDPMTLDGWYVIAADIR